MISDISYFNSNIYYFISDIKYPNSDIFYPNSDISVPNSEKTSIDFGYFILQFGYLLFHFGYKISEFGTEIIKRLIGIIDYSRFNFSIGNFITDWQKGYTLFRIFLILINILDLFIINCKDPYILVIVKDNAPSSIHN